MHGGEMKRYEMLMLAAFLAAAGCSKRAVVCAVLPVPPEDARSPRYNLPLDEKSQADLVERLAYGLNNANRKDHVGADSDAREAYKKRLLVLGAAALPLRKDLGGGTYKGWLTGPTIQQVVDSREQFTPSDTQAPLAVSDGRFWWVFYPDQQDRLTAVMAVKLNACQNLQEAQH
jgi:hypothetical protein